MQNSYDSLQWYEPNYSKKSSQLIIFLIKYFTYQGNLTPPPPICLCFQVCQLLVESISQFQQLCLYRGQSM